MKKYLLLSLSILSIFFFNNRVDALTFENGTEVDTENYIYYFYNIQKEDFENYKYFTSVKSLTGTYRQIIFFNDDTIPDFYSNGTNIRRKVNSKNCSFDISTGKNSCSILTSSSYGGPFYLDYSNYTYATDLKANITKEDLKNYKITIPVYKITYYLNDEVFKEIEVEEGSSHTLLEYEYDSNLYVFSGWTVDDDKDLNNITDNIIIRATLEEKEINTVYVKNFEDFPITRTDFYVLLVLLSAFFLFLFLKWCFPMKGGRDL